MVTALLIGLLIGASPAMDAKQAYDKALKYSQAGEYEAALPWFQKAYDLSKHRPSTIVALAQCERSLKMYDQAIDHFREYLALKPAPKDSPVIEETVALLEDLRKEQLAQPKPPPPVEPPATPEIATAPPPPPPEVAPPPPPPAIAESTPPPAEEESGSIFESPVFWIVSGAVVVAAASGVAIGLAVRPDPEIYGGTSGVVLEK